MKSANHEREPSDDYDDDDYDDQYDYPPSPTTRLDGLPSKLDDMHLDDDLPDTTMLDTVVLPAIASVSINFHCSLLL